jgi:hypothetical protein
MLNGDWRQNQCQPAEHEAVTAARTATGQAAAGPDCPFPV